MLWEDSYKLEVVHLDWLDRKGEKREKEHVRGEGD